jgi:lipopolysaccharide biosynthesis glycosyltransferase
VQITPLLPSALAGFDGRRDGSNDFTYSRFLVPYLCDFLGHAIFADGDMICRADIAELWRMRDFSAAAQVVKHKYRTKAPRKYLGARNEDYPRKNWSSLVLWNCSHFVNRQLTPETVGKMTGTDLHRFSWIPDERLGALPKEWNWLVSEYPENPDAKLLHYTLGTPCFRDYANCPQAADWHQTYQRLTEPRN